MLDSRSPFHNIYVGIDKSLLDPVLDAAIDKTMKMYERTFWAINPALTFCQACIAMAKRGKNVNQIAFFLGPGGVGLSLFTAHLNAMYGAKNHKYFDPRIFYNDDLMMKFLPLLKGAFYWIGQERPTGNMERLREDLLKKFAIAEGLSGRPPYAVIVKLTQLIG